MIRRLVIDVDDDLTPTNEDVHYAAAILMLVTDNADANKTAGIILDALAQGRPTQVVNQIIRLMEAGWQDPEDDTVMFRHPVNTAAFKKLAQQHFLHAQALRLEREQGDTDNQKGNENG